MKSSSRGLLRSLLLPKNRYKAHHELLSFFKSLESSSPSYHSPVDIGRNATVMNFRGLTVPHVLIGTLYALWEAYQTFSVTGCHVLPFLNSMRSSPKETERQAGDTRNNIDPCVPFFIFGVRDQIEGAKIIRSENHSFKTKPIALSF